MDEPHSKWKPKSWFGTSFCQFKHFTNALKWLRETGSDMMGSALHSKIHRATEFESCSEFKGLAYFQTPGAHLYQLLRVPRMKDDLLGLHCPHRSPGACRACQMSNASTIKGILLHRASKLFLRISSQIKAPYLGFSRS